MKEFRLTYDNGHSIKIPGESIEVLTERLKNDLRIASEISGECHKIEINNSRYVKTVRDGDGFGIEIGMIKF